MKVTREQLIEMINKNEDVTQVDVSEITDMSSLFKGNKTFNQDISQWNFSNMTYMIDVFKGTIFFNKNLFNFKKYVKQNNIFSKNMFFTNESILLGDY